MSTRTRRAKWLLVGRWSVRQTRAVHLPPPFFKAARDKMMPDNARFVDIWRIIEVDIGPENISTYAARPSCRSMPPTDRIDASPRTMG